MIHLDTNFVIALVTYPTPAALKAKVLTLLNTNEKFAVSAIVWSEFLNGPVTNQEVHDATVLLESRILPFDAQEAEMAAKLFNLTGRRRGAQTDGFIAATAICARAPLATLNRKDFAPYVSAGLSLA